MTVCMTAVSANEKVYRTGNAPALETPVYLFPGSYACFQVNIFADENYQDGAYLRVVGGPAARAVKMRRVGLIPAVEDSKYGHDDYYDLREDHLYPDVLEPFDPRYIHAAPGNNQTFFFRIDDNEKIPYGEQTITVRFYAAKKFVKSVKVKLVKMPEALPEQKCIYTNWMHYDSFVTQHRVRLFSRDFYKVFKSYLDAAAIGGQNMVLVPLFTPAFDTEIGGERPTAQLLDISEPEAGKFVFDFEKTNAFIKFVLANGMKYLEMPPFFTQWGAKNAPKIMVRNAKGRVARRFGWETDALSEEYKNFLDQLLVALNANLRENGWEEISFFHISDEPSAEHEESYRRAIGAVSDLLAGHLCGDALSHYEYYEKGYVSLPIVHSMRMGDFDGRCDNLMFYYTGGEARSTNRLITGSPARTRILGLMLYRYNSRGFLHWGYNFYYGNMSHGVFDPRVEPSFYKNIPGGTYLAYPSTDRGAYPSLREKYMKEAINDYRALRLLESLIGREAVLAICRDFFGAEVDYLTIPQSGEEMLAFRDRINAEIEKHI